MSSVALKNNSQRKEIDQILQHLSDISGRSVSFFSEQTIKYLALKAWQIQGIKEAQKQIKNGEVIPGDVAIEWIKSWGTQTPLPTPSYKNYQ